jgi:hypothetical protein
VSVRQYGVSIASVRTDTDGGAAIGIRPLGEDTHTDPVLRTLDQGGIGTVRPDTGMETSATARKVKRGGVGNEDAYVIHDPGREYRRAM